MSLFLQVAEQHSHARSVAVAIITLVMVSGCGGSDGPTLAIVTGTVTLDGEPVQHAVIRFLPDNARRTSGPIAAGTADESGHYTLMSPGGRRGAIVGHHLVTIICDELPTREVSEGVFEDVALTCKVPSRYASEKTSGLTAEVQDGKNVLDFELHTEQ